MKKIKKIELLKKMQNLNQIFILLLTILNIVLSTENTNKYLINKNIKFLKQQQEKYYFKTFTKQPIGTSIGKIEYTTITTSDIDFKLNLLYIIDKTSTNVLETSDFFKVNKLTNEILVNKLQLSSRKYYYNLLAVNKTNDYVINNIRLIIKVINQDYLIPKFLINPYNIQISDNTPVNTLVLKLHIVSTDDVDSGDDIGSIGDSLVVYKLETDDVNFSINENNGDLSTKTRLNRGTIKLAVNAVNLNLPQYVATTVVNIQIAESSDFFDQTEYTFSLYENEDYTKRPVVFQPRPLHGDTILSYVLTGSNEDMAAFVIDQIKGSVLLVDKLDYELKSTYRLTIIASDSTLEPFGYSYSNLNINIIDVNSNPPMFTEPAYDFYVLNSTTTTTGFTIGNIEAYDRDSKNNSKIAYFIENSNELPFQIGLFNGTIYLTSSGLSLNLYDFNVTAKDRYAVEPDCLSSTVNVRVSVLNINENILFKFENESYYLNASEEAIIGLQILTLNIINDKKTVLNFLISSGNSDNIFIVNKLSNTKAQVVLSNTLDYRKQSEHHLIIKAIDQSGLYATSNVFIAVLPINAQQPRFTKDLYDFTVYENASVGALVGNINAIDGDFGDNGRIKYSLDNAGDFKLDENDGNLYVANKLDREIYDSVTLYVIATDNGTPQRMDRALIKIKILDCNDNAPEFTKQNYSTSVYEDSKAGTYLLRVEAVDKDIGDNAVIRYSFSNPNIPFTIDPVSGIVRVSAKLDRETQDFYDISLIATDSGVPALSSSTSLQIVILDVNDNAPNFGSNELVFYLLENQPIGTEIANITATDADLGPNADIVYKMLDGFDYFDIKSSGRYNTVILTSKFIADYESNKNQFVFNLRAYSGLLFTDCLVKVLIKDVNDNAPVLANPFKIVFNNYKNNFLIESFARIPAYDLDVSDNLTFTLLDSIGKQFVNLDSITGEILLKPILNSNNQINAAFAVSVTGKSVLFFLLNF